MEKQDYNAIITVDTAAAEVFENIISVAKWWTGELEGRSQKLGDEFTVHFGDMHVSTQKIVELIPGKKLVWLVTHSKLSFVKNQREWDNTTIIFEINRQDNKTQLNFTHIGLVPQTECYKDCTKGWDYYIKGSLYKLLTKGKGTPGL